MTSPALPRRLFCCCLLLLTAGPLTAQTPAADRYRQLLAVNPAEGVALDRLWLGAEERGTTAALLEEYRLAAENNTGPAAFGAALVHGHLLKKAGRPDESAAAYRRAGVLDPASPLPDLALAGLLTARGEPVRAAEALEAALTKLPTDVRRQVDTLLALGTARQVAGDPAKAAETWERAVALAPNDLALRERLAAAGESAGDFGRAAAQWEFIETHAPTPESRALASRSLGRVRAAAGEFEPARDALLRGLALVGPGNWLRGEFQRALVALHARAGRLPELEARWKTEADRAPRDPGARLQLAEFARLTGDRAGERGALESVVNLLPRAKEPALRLARLLADAEDVADLPRASALLDGLLKAQPGNFDLLTARAELDLRAGRPDDAAGRLEAAVNARPDDDTLRAAALAFFNTHRLTAATERQLRAAVNRKPDAEEPALALAGFLFKQRQPDAARAVLDDFLKRVPADATRLSRAADLCRTQGAPADALRFARRAAEAAPGDAARRLALAEAELGAGETDAARADFLRAADGAGDAEEAERRLFATFQPAPGADPETVRKAEAAATAFSKSLETAAHERPEAAGRLARWLLFRRLPTEALGVVRAALATVPESRPLRELLARTALEVGDRPLALETVEKLLADDPAPADRARHRRTLAQLRQEEGDTDGALAILAELAAGTPSRETLTDLALAQQRADRWYDALATWERLLALPGLPPGARAEARRPLVAVLSRLGQHERALEILDGALDAANGDARAGLFREALALAAEHGLLPRFAARAEGRIVAARPGDAAPLTELAAIRRQEGRERDADDLLERAALTAPDGAGALGPLSALVDAAERRGDVDVAVTRQERLVALAGPDAGADALARLAELRASVGDPAGAVKAWNSLATRFPRDPAGLARAAAFFESPEGDDLGRARELLGRAAALEPGDLARQLRLGALAASAGDPVTARGAFGAVLERTPGEVPGEPLELPETLPPTGAVLATPGTGAVREERRQRLAAIRGLAGLAMSGDERARFLEPFRNQADTAPGEALWAGHFGNAPDLALDVLGRAADANVKPADDRLPRLFVVLALRAGDSGRLGKFLRPEGADDRRLRLRRDAAMDGLRAFLPTVRDRERPISDATLAALFPEPGTSRETLWRAAAGIFSTNARYPEAAALGERALAKWRTGRATVAVALARWQLWCGRPDAARAGLRAALADPDAPALPPALAAIWGNDDADESDETGLAEGSDNGLEVVRLLHGLLPAGERAAFRAGMLARSGGLAPTRAAEMQALLAGLAGDVAGARAAAARLVALRPTGGGTTRLGSVLTGNPAEGSETDARRWSFLLGAVRRFSEAGLDDVALAVGADGLADPGLLGLQGASQREGSLRELREGVALLRFRAAGGDPAREAAAGDEFLRARPSGQSVVNVANALLGVGLPAAAERFVAGARGGLPEENAGGVAAELRRLRVRARLALGNSSGAETLLRAALRERTASSTAVGGLALDLNPWTDAGLPLADLLERAGDLPAACRLLANAPTRPAGPWSVLATRLAALQEKLGQPDAAAETLRAILKVNPMLVPARISLADLEDRLGHGERAVAGLEEGITPPPASPAPPVALALAKRDLLAGRTERPVELARRFIRGGQVPVAVNVAELFVGENVPPNLRPVGRRLLAAAFHAGKDGQMRFMAQRTLVTKFCDPAADRADFLRELGRLGRLAQLTPGLRPMWQTIRYDLLSARPEFVGELETALRRDDDGTADLRLLRLALRDREHPAADLPARVERLAKREKVDVLTLQEVARTLDEGGRVDLAAGLAARLSTFLPQNTEFAMLTARAQWLAGDHAGAEATLAAREAMGIFDAEEPLKVADAWGKLGETDRARGVLERLVERQPGARPGAARMALAKLELARKNPAAARPLLRAALTDPALTDLGPALDYLAARGTLADPAGWGDLAMTASVRARLLPAAFDRLAERGEWDGARALVGSQLALLLEYAPAATRLRTHAEESGDVGERLATVALFYRVIAETGDSADPPPRLAHEIARLLTTVAATLPPGNSERLKYRIRASILEPADGAIALVAAEECAAEGYPDMVAVIWTRLLFAADTLPADREEAKRRLGRH